MNSPIRLKSINTYQAIKFRGRMETFLAVLDEKGIRRPGTANIELLLHESMVYIYDREKHDVSIVACTNIADMKPLTDAECQRVWKVVTDLEAEAKKPAEVVKPETTKVTKINTSISTI